MTKEQSKERAKQNAVIMLAYAEGKKIQFRTINFPEWKDIDMPEFSFGDYNDYRIKPEPRILYVAVDSKNNVISADFEKYWSNYKIIEFVEKI